MSLGDRRESSRGAAFRCTLCKETFGICDCPPWENARFECDECGERLEACQCMVDPIDGSMLQEEEE